MYDDIGVPEDYRPGRPLLVVLSGPSGVGKDAVLQEMRLLDRPWHFVVTATTRPKRVGERNGIDYIFLSLDEFEALRAQEGFLESANVYGRWYGVPRSQVRGALELGRDVILKVDVQGSETVRKLAPDAVLIFLAPPSLAELERRLRQRNTDDGEQVALRIKTARAEMGEVTKFDYLVVNENGKLDETVRAIDAIITAEHVRIPPRVVKL